MTHIPKQAVAEVLASLRRLGSQSMTLVPASLDRFPHLDVTAFDAFRDRLERESFRYHGDLEFLEVSQTPDALMLPTPIRVMSGDDGQITSEFYEVRNRRLKLVSRLLKGLANLRWVDAPNWFFHAIRVRHCTGFETEFSDGSWVITSNAEGAGAISSPPCVETCIFPYGTSCDILLARHRERVRARIAQGVAARRCFSLDDVVAAQKRMWSIKSAYRQSIAWVARGELQAMSSDPRLADAMFEAIRSELDGD